MVNYSAPLGVLSGLEAVKSAVEATLKKVTTQHALTTTVVEILAGGRTARSLAYLTASHYGMGQYEGQVRCVFSFLREREEFDESLVAALIWVLKFLFPLASGLCSL